MKPLLLLCLTVSLSAPVYANSYRADANKGAPSSDHAVTKDKTGQVETYESDAVTSGQAATKRDVEADRNYRMCRDANSSWLRPGDAGYVSCMNDPKMMRR